MKTKKGATSFYIVAFSTLILVIIAASFTAVILSEMARTANDDLSQSAYDSALAGVEDAKLAFYNYQKCLDMGETEEEEPIGGNDITCGNIMWWMNHGDCAAVAKILGRIDKNNEDIKEVVIQESSNGDNSMQQAYTCVKFKSTTKEYKTTLSGSKPKVIRVRLGKDSSDKQIEAKAITKVVIGWYSNKNDSAGGYNFKNIGSKGVEFPGFGELITPPTLSVGLIQTADTFSLDDFKEVKTDEGKQQTNRGTLFLVPTGGTNPLGVRNLASARANDEYGNYVSAYTSARGENVISKELFVKSNDRKVKNLPIAVYCNTSANSNGGYACSATLELPEAYNGGRNDDTFAFVVSTPYGQSGTDIELQFFCSEDEQCGQPLTSDDGETAQTPATLDKMQVVIDSTGRANDLYRRVETRLALESSSLPYPIYGITLLGEDDATDKGLLRKLTVPTTCEWEQEFGGPTC